MKEPKDKRTKEYKEWKKAQEAKKSQGLGDTIEKVTKVTGIKKAVELFSNGKDCGCEERKQKLNHLFPSNLKARCLTEEEYTQWNDFREEDKKTLTSKEVDWLCKMYSDVFNRQYWRPTCGNCASRKLITMIKRMDKVMETYESTI